MSTHQEFLQYQRQLIMPEWGIEAQEKLKKAKVLVVGAGGLGCPILQYLAGAGVGTIGIIDGDTVSISNLHRQVLFGHGDVGQNKAFVAKQRLEQLNPFVDFEIVEDFLDNDNVLDLFDDYDLVVDGTDNFETRYRLNDACVMLGKPFVHGSLMKFQGQVSVFNFQGGPTYRCLYPTPPSKDQAPNCETIGVIGVLPGIIGCYQALEVLKCLTGVGEPLSGKLLVLDALTYQQFVLKIKVMPDNVKIKQLSDYEIFCTTKNTLKPLDSQSVMSQETFKTIGGTTDYTVLDCRDSFSFNTKNVGGLNIPLDFLNEKIETLDPSADYIVVCMQGHKSQKALEILQNKGFKSVRHLDGGLNAFWQ